MAVPSYSKQIQNNNITNTFSQPGISSLGECWAVGIKIHTSVGGMDMLFNLLTLKR